MKKFISMVMAAAMVVSLVPATAFAITGEVTGSAKVIKAVDLTATQAESAISVDAPELQIKVSSVDWKHTTTDDSTVDMVLSLDNAKFNTLADGNGDPLTDDALDNAFDDLFTFVCEGSSSPVVATGDALDGAITNVKVNKSLDKVEFTVTHLENQSGRWVETPFHKDDVISIDLNTQLTKTKVGTQATVTVKADGVEIANNADLVYATVVGKGIKVELDEEIATVATEEVEYLDDIVIKPTIGSTFNVVKDKTWTAADPEDITLTLSKGFEFVFDGTADINSPESGTYTLIRDEYTSDNKIKLAYTSWCTASSEMVLEDLKIEATTAKPGDPCYLTVKIDGLDAVKLEVAKVVDYTVIMSVDADEDVPVMWSGVDAANTGLTADDEEHWSLEVTVEETFPGAWAMRKGFTFSLPEGVYVTDLTVTDTDGLKVNGADQNEAAVEGAFDTAFINGDQVAFEFAKRTFDDVDNRLNDVCATMTFKLELVAVPTFVGDVALKLEGALLDTQEVTIAKFVAPYVVKAEQNDVKIDYRYTSIDTPIVITEAEADLWERETVFDFFVENPAGLIVFEDEADFAVNEASELELKGERTAAGVLSFTVKSESNEEAAEVTISGVELFMQRNIPAGPYALTMGGTMEQNFLRQPLLVADGTSDRVNDLEDVADASIATFGRDVKEAWINVVTAGREVDDASFTTTVVVPVGETTMYAGEKAITLDVPAYINADGYTMLPVRAVATALGINNDAVQWDQATKTVIIMYGQRIITMTAGSSVVYVSGTAIPAKSAVEIVDGRAFLGLRDLATTLGVTAVNYDATTKTATLN